MFIKIIKSMLGLFLVFSWSYTSATDVKTMSMPILKQCENEAKVLFSDIPEYKKIKVNFVYFDLPLFSHEDVIGYVELSSPVLGSNGLRLKLNQLRSKCYPESSIVVDRNDSAWKETLIRKLEFLDTVKVDRAYVNIDSDKADVWFRKLDLQM